MHDLQPGRARERDRRRRATNTASSSRMRRFACLSDVTSSARSTYPYSATDPGTSSPTCFVAGAVIRGERDRGASTATGARRCRARSFDRSAFAESSRRFSCSTARFTNTTPASRIPPIAIQRIPPRARARFARVRRFGARGRAVAPRAVGWRRACAGRGAQTFIPTRRRADCERGLRATSAAVGRIARRGIARSVGVRPADADGEVGRARAAVLLAAQELLDDPVLERVERDHAEPAAGPQHLERGGQRALERAELVVDLDPQRLEDALGRMTLAEPRRRRDRRLDHLDEIAVRSNGCSRAAPHDRARDLARVALLAVALEDVGELALAQPR